MTWPTTCRALAIFVSAVIQEAIPSFLVKMIPARGRTTENIQIMNYRYIRCIVREWDDKTIQVAVTNQDSSEELLTVDYMDTPEYIISATYALCYAKGCN